LFIFRRLAPKLKWGTLAGSMRLRLALVLTLFTTLAVAENPLGAPLPASLRKAATDQLNLPDPARRIGATVRFRADGSDAADDFRSGLTRSETTATANLRRLLQLVKPTDPAIDALKKQVEEYATLRDAAKLLVQTDHHKDKQKFAEMDKAYAAAEKAFERLMRTVKPNGNTPLVQLLDALQWAAEVKRDEEFCDGKSTSITKLPLSEVFEIENGPDALKELVTLLEPLLTLREYHRAVATAHTMAKWAKSDQVQYANLLNSRREVLGMPPFLLSEKLSAACFQHSEEMVKLKYFAHESPVEKNKTPWDRIRNAQFEGDGGGECIYSGGSSAQAAHTGWWYSDGHRLILYGGGSVQGIARFGGGMWTFETGTYKKYPL
jgi:hypothetical protein